MKTGSLIAGALLVVAALNPASAVAQPASPAAVDPQAIAAARELIDLMKVEATLDKMFVDLAPVFAQGAIGAMQEDPAARAAVGALVDKGKGGQPKLVAIMSEEFLKSIRRQYPAMKDRVAREYAAVLTAAELRQLTAFFRTGPGAKWLQLTPALEKKLAEAGGELGQVAGEEAGRNAIERAISEMLPEAKAPQT